MQLKASYSLSSFFTYLPTVRSLHQKYTKNSPFLEDLRDKVSDCVIL